MAHIMAKALIGFSNVVSVLSARSDSSVVQHAVFHVHDGVIDSGADKTLRLSVLGEIKAGSPITLGKCGIHAHDKFKMKNGQIRLIDSPSMCLNAKGGAGAGAELVTYQCGVDEVSENEEFEHGKDGRIRMKRVPNLCVNIKEARISHGTGLVLYECGTSEKHIHDIFDYHEHSFVVRSNPLLRLHAKELQGPGEILLGGCDHENFDFDPATKQIRLRDTDLCINAEGGMGAGAPLIAWQCGDKKKITDNEKFTYDARRGVIAAYADPNLSFNVKEANVAAGTPIVLYPLVVEEM